MQMGADGVFVGSGIFKSGNPKQLAQQLALRRQHSSMIQRFVAEASRGLGEAMVGINVADIPVPHRLSAERGW